MHSDILLQNKDANCFFNIILPVITGEPFNIATSLDIEVKDQGHGDLYYCSLVVSD